MGQETSLNCRSSGKPEQHEIQTTHANAIHLIKSRNARPEGQVSDLRSKKSATTHLDNQSSSSFALSTASHPRGGPSSSPTPPCLPSHENILKVSATPFPNAERVSNRYHERPGKSLAEIVQSRYNTTMHFPQTQTVLLVESLIYALRYLEKEGIAHHDFYPTNVHYHNGKFKISNPIGVQATAYTITHQRKRFSFLSPQLISQLLNDTPQTDIPQEVMLKADIFAIGMMALEFCTLQPSAECYDEENYSLVDKVIKDRLVKVAKLYSPNIADCIAEMLRYQVEERISVEELALLVFLNSQQEKIDPPMPPNTPQEKKAPLPPPQRQYQQNPPYVQQQYLILPPGAPPPPPQQPLPLGQNAIALPTPNYAYTRIGPNNQGLLSPTTLTNKLKVIQLIHQKPQEEQESEGQMSSLPSNMLPTVSSQPPAGNMQRMSERRQAQGRQGDPRLLYALPQSQTQQRVVTNPTQYPSSRKEQPLSPPLPQRDTQIRQQYRPQPLPRPQQKTYEPPSRQYSSRPQRPTEQPPRGSRPSYQPNKFLSKTDQNGQTLEQRVERILQMSRSIQ